MVPTWQRKLLANGFSEYTDEYFDPSLSNLPAPPMFEGKAKVGPNAPGAAAKSTETAISEVQLEEL